MKYYLMHKDISIAEMELNSNGDLSKVRVSNQYKDHVPLGGQMNLMKFHDWWKDRAVPRTRKGANHALRELNLTSTNSMLVNNLALSLTDCYWINPANSNLYWKDVSLYRNVFKDIFGELTFDTSSKLDMRYKTYFRYASSQGELQKKWCINNDGRRFLVKGNWGSSYQQSLNEVFASSIYKSQGVFPFTQYYLTKVSVDGGDNGLGCYSYNFCNENVEFVSAWEVIQTGKTKSNTSWYNLLKNACINKLGFDENYIDNFLGYEIMVDYIISNTDRHMNNIGVLRNPDTLEYLGFAPIYDSGNSMFFRNKDISLDFSKIKTHSFLQRESDLLRLVKNKNLIDFDKLPDKEFFYEVYSKDIPERLYRMDRLYEAYKMKVNRLYKFCNS